MIDKYITFGVLIILSMAFWVGALINLYNKTSFMNIMTSIVMFAVGIGLFLISLNELEEQK